MDASTNLRLRNSLLTIEEKFLTAASQGTDSLTRFAKAWTALQEELVAARNGSTLEAGTLSLACAVSTSLTVICQSFLDVGNMASSCSSRLIMEWQDALDSEVPLRNSSIVSTSPSPQSHRLPKPSLQSPRHPTTTPITFALATILPSRIPSGAASITDSTRSASDPNPLPEFIEHAYKFFVANIFNPYPTRDEKQTIVDETNNTRVTLTSISNWFTNARRRCGWSEILKRRCNGNRDEMVDLAKRVFVKPDPRYPVDPQIVAEFMDMKENLESMYERKTRTSAWIEDLEDMDELVNPVTEEERLAAKKRETEEEREARKREKEMLKEQREFERQKRKMQAEALRKAEKVAKGMQREQEKAKTEQRMASFAVPYPPTGNEDEELDSDPVLVAGGKRKFEIDNGSIYGFSMHRHASPASSLSSSFTSDFASEGRMPSLTWSDSGDERPYKRNRSSPSSPATNSSHLLPALEIPAHFDYSFGSEPPSGLTDDPSVFDSIFDFAINSSDILVTSPKTPMRGQKRQHDSEEGAPTPQAKRAKSVVPAVDSELVPAPSTSLFTPTLSNNGTPMQTGRRRSSLVPFDLETVLGLGPSHPQPAQITPPDASMPLELGVFDWSSRSNPELGQFDPNGVLDPHADFSQLFELFSQHLPPGSEPQLAASTQTEQHDAHLELPRFDLPVSDFPQEHLTSSTLPTRELPETQALDLSGLMSGLISDEALNDMGLDFSSSVPPTPPDLSRSSSVSPAWTPTPTTPSPEKFLAQVELEDKALSKERKRRELEEKRAALEREHARLAEMERELEDD